MNGIALDLDAAYRAHSSWLEGWLRRRTRCPQQAADLLQDTFCRLLERDGPAAPRNIRVFLAVVARRLLIDDVRRRQVERLYLAELAALGESVDDLTPERITQAASELAMILDFLSTLQAEVREAFLLRRIDGLPHADIAVRLGICDRTVKRHIARAYAACYAFAYPD